MWFVPFLYASGARIILSMFVACLLSACAPARKPVPPGVIPAAKPLTVSEEQYGHQVLNALTEKYELDYNHPRGSEVQTVVDRLTAAAKADKDPWHVYVLKHPTLKNAAATRGNHVFIWSSMLEYTKDEDELAAIMAHEIAHVLAGHTEPDPNEEIKKILIQVGALAAGIAVSAATRNPNFSTDLGRITAGLTQEVGNSFLVYPFSRDNELEADQIGLFLMATAKYDPRKAVDFWRRSQNDSSFSSGPSFLSTHPPAEARLKQYEVLLPRALARFEGKELPAAPEPIQAQNSSSGPLSGATSAGATASARTGGGAEDSFDLSNNSRNRQSSESLPPQPPTNYSEQNGATSLEQNWEIISERAFLYRAASLRSRKLGELSRGANIRVVGIHQGWLEVTEPEKGFVREKDGTRK